MIGGPTLKSAIVKSLGNLFSVPNELAELVTRTFTWLCVTTLNCDILSFVLWLRWTPYNFDVCWHGWQLQCSFFQREVNNHDIQDAWKRNHIILVTWYVYSVSMFSAVLFTPIFAAKHEMKIIRWIHISFIFELKLRISPKTKLNDDVIWTRVDFWNKRWRPLKNSGMLEKTVVYPLGYLQAPSHTTPP